MTATETDRAGRSRFVRQLPEPARFWIAFAPRRWRVDERPWCDLSSGRLEGLRQRGGGSVPDPELAGVDDLVYLPPVAAELAPERAALVARATEAGVPTLVQVALDEEPPPAATAVIYDPLLALLHGEVERLYHVPAGGTVVWPLLSGVTDAPELCEEGCELLAARGAGCVQPVLMEVDPRDRRSLAEERGEDVFDALFHGSPASERSFARIAARHGLEVFARRPPTGARPRIRRNRQIAADLALAGELWLRLERAEATGQALFRAARGVEQSRHDLEALAKEKNLDVLSWLDAFAVEAIEDRVAKGRMTVLDELLAEYVAG